MSAWTDERLERLRQLWGDGFSASQIAADLGGVSRNAVIGKAHRIGLKGRTPRRATVVAAPSRVTLARSALPRAAAKGPAAARAKKDKAASPADVTPPATTPEVPATETGRPVDHRPHCRRPANCAARGRSHCGPCHAAALREGLVEDGPLPVRAAVFDPAGRETVSLGDHRHAQCRWPFDIADGEVRYCGARRLPGGVYCAEHAAIAYVPNSREKQPRSEAAKKIDAEHAAKRRVLGGVR